MKVDSPQGFLRALAVRQPKNRDLAVAAIWWEEVHGVGEGLTIQDICRRVESAGYAKQNGSRLARQVAQDGRTRKLGRRRFGISVRARADLDREFSDVAPALPVLQSDSVVPREMVAGTRTYLERVVTQVNGSFDHGFYDCTAVMIRRLIETLIIEVYDRQVRVEDLEGADGNILPLSRLITTIKSDKVITLSRETEKGLETIKKFGDQSAHNRRFIARRTDITRIRDAVRIASEELLHLAFPNPT